MKNWKTEVSVFTLKKFNFFHYGGFQNTRILPSDPPSERDLSFSNAEIRRRICENIGNSGFFHWFNLVPVRIEKMIDERNHERFWDIIRVYNSRLNLYEYTNEYKRMELNVSDLYDVEEYVFVCPFQDAVDEDYEIFYYISKEYNVSPSARWYKPGRFIFGVSSPTIPIAYLILAEEPANVYTQPGFNIELHYLQRRNHVQTGKPRKNIIYPLR